MCEWSVSGVREWARASTYNYYFIRLIYFIELEVSTIFAKQIIEYDHYASLH